MQTTHGRLALAAYQSGDIPAAKKVLHDAGDEITCDPLALQLLAITSADPINEHVLLQHAAYETLAGTAEPFFNLGVVEQGQGFLDRALLLYQQALQIDPNHIGALNNASDLLRRRGRSRAAWDLLTRYLKAGGAPQGLEIRLAKVADDCGHVEEARHWFAQASEREPVQAALKWEQAMQQLRDEEFAAGWVGYEARKSIYDHTALGIVSYSAEEWDGSPLKGRSLLVHKEQGLGDTIMFASFLRRLAADQGQLHLAVQPPLTRLFAANFPEAQVWSSVSAPGFETEEHQGWRLVAGPIDCQLAFGSLPLALHHNQPAAAEMYLRPVPAEQAAWERRLRLLTPHSHGQLRAGIVTMARRDGSTGPGIAEGAPKSISARLLWPLDHPNVAWFGLHDQSTCDELADAPLANLVDTSPWLLDMCDTAALIANLDVVVAVDTAVAHLAGAMGKKVLLMLRRHSDWRWGRTRTDSYWYNDVEVFRQDYEGDWAPVVSRVAARIDSLAEDPKQIAVRP